MISIIICSRNGPALQKVSKQIEDTVGVTYELIAIDNSNNKYGICDAYNIGAAQAKYGTLCFMHEDIRFHTDNWGKLVIQVLFDSCRGIIGVAGGTYQPKAPAGWGDASQYVGINVIHTTPTQTHHNYINHSETRLLEVAALDGLWLCCRKQVWQEFKFDSSAFPGFHFYDVDFCIRVSTKYRNYLIYDVLIEHFSHGTFDKVWLQNAIQFYRKRVSYLPVNPGGLSESEQKLMDLLVMQGFIERIIRAGLRKKDILFCLFEWLKLNPLNRDNLYRIRQQLLKKE
jgi:glycosyltransferase involved in cell wall biosynthesis